MKIQKVKIKDFKILEDVDVDLNGKNLILIGDNGVGKSSFMQFIEIALGRTDNIPPNAEGEGEVITNKDGEQYTFQVKFKEGKPQLTVTAPNGLKDNRKSAIAGIVGAIDFNIDEFVRLSDTKAGRKKQVEIFKSLLPADIKEELEKYEVNIQVNYDTRTDTNRRIKEIKGFLKSSEIYGDHRNIKEVDITALSKKLTEAQEMNVKIAGVRERQEERTKEIEQLKARLSDLNSKSKEAEDFLKRNKVVDVTAMEEQLKNSSAQNKLYNEAQDLIRRETEVENLEKEAGEATALIDSSRQAIEDAVKDMAGPVEGLKYDEEGLIYNGVPVSTSSLSTSEIIHLGCKLKMAQNPDFGVLMIEHGESLGSARLKEIQDLAKENDWQIILEQVQRGEEKLKFEFIKE